MNRRARRPNQHGTPLEAPEETGSLDPEPEAESSREGGARSAWLGRGVAFAKALLGVALVAGAACGVAWAAHRYALTSPRFAIAEVEAEGALRLSVDQLRQQAGITPGQNIFAVDLDNAERRLLENPWIEQVRVSRELPRNLRIQLKEREAAAGAVIGGQLYVVDKAGEPFKRLEPEDGLELPLVTGISPENLARDRKRELARIGTALEVLRAYERIALSKAYPPGEVHLLESGDVVLSVGKNGTALHLGSGPYRKKLLMAERVMNRLGSKGKSAGLVFLDNRAHPERVVVRMR